MCRLGLNIGVALSAIAVILFTTPALADCDRDVLIAATELYMAAQTAGSLDDFGDLLTSDYKYQENNKASTVAQGVLGTALNIAHNKSTADTVACASYTELVALTPKPYVIGTQLRHTSDGANITLIDVIAATTGSLSFNAAQTLKYIEAEDWSPLNVSAQPTRALLQQTADAYLDMWTNASAYNDVPWGTPCERVEGSSLNSPCTVGAPRGGYTTPISDRRYVIDVTMGSIDAMCDFAAVGGVADSHEFRVENNKLRYVHTITL